MTDQDTKKRIVEAGTYLFGVKGFDATSTREIAQRAGVNIASLNYHFKSKQGLLKEVTLAVAQDFKAKIEGLAKDTSLSAAEFALSIYSMITEDNIKFLNHFKLFLDSGTCVKEVETQPLGYVQLRYFLKKELKESVPEEEIIWASSMIFTYIMHTGVMSGSWLGKEHICRFLPEQFASIPKYIRQLVETLIRDLNNRYP